MRDSNLVYDQSGSSATEAVEATPQCMVRFAPKDKLKSLPVPLCAITGGQRSQQEQSVYSVTSSARESGVGTSSSQAP